jgi:large subunit ribosomal protein L35
MPKLKTHKSAEKRFRISGTGLVMRSKQGTSHLRRNKSKKVKRAYDEMMPVNKVDQKRIKMLLPYGAK